MKRIAGILGVFFSVVGFSIYYLIAVKCYPLIPAIFVKFSYYSLFVGLALSFLALGLESNRRIKNLIYYTGASFWVTVLCCYLLKDMGLIKSRDMSMYFLIGTSVICFILYFCKNRSKLD